MIQTFKLINALGANYNLLDPSNLYAPFVIGMSDVTQYEQAGEFFIPLSEKYGQQVVAGTMVFQGNYDERYIEFMKFCQHSPLTLVYKTEAGTFQIPVRLTGLEKTKTDCRSYLKCSVTFTALARMYKSIVANNTGSAGGGKAYNYTYDYVYGDFVADTVTIDSDSIVESPCKISIFGPCTQPLWRHYVDGESVATGYYNGTIPENHKLVIDTTTMPYSIEELDLSNNLIADRYELCDFSTERFFLLKHGHNTISVSHSDPDSIRVMVEGYIFYEAV